MANRQRVPIFHDDLSFHDRTADTFRDMQRRMDTDFGGRGFGMFDRSPWNWEEDIDRMCGDRQQLKPRTTRVQDVSKDNFGSRESLDDNASKNMYVEHPQTKSRAFHTSFDVKDYNPNDISVKADGDTLIIMARHEEDVGGHKNVREFSRKIKIPADVDIDKLSSTLSNDGILTIQAPVPPKYTSVAYVNPSKPVTSNGTGSSLQHGAHGARSSPVPPAQPQPQSQPQTQYQYQQPAGGQYQPPTTTILNQPQQPTTILNQPPQISKMSAAPTHSPPQPRPTPASQVSQPQPAYPKREIPPPELQQPPPPLATQTTSQPLAPPPLFQPELLPLALDTPVFKDSPNGNGRDFELALEVQRPFTPEDVVVKLEGMSLKVEATREEKSQGKTSTSTMARAFDLTEDLDPASVEAMLRSDGCLLIKGKAKPKS